MKKSFKTLSTGQPSQVVVTQGQPQQQQQQQQIQIQQKGQMTGGSIIITSTPNSIQPQQLQIQQVVQPQQIQIQQQQQVQQAVMQHQQPQMKPAIVQNVVRPAMQQQQPQQPQVQVQQPQPNQQPPGSQQVSASLNFFSSLKLFYIGKVWTLLHLTKSQLVKCHLADT